MHDRRGWQQRREKLLPPQGLKEIIWVLVMFNVRYLGPQKEGSPGINIHFGVTGLEMGFERQKTELDIQGNGCAGGMPF